MSWTSRGRCCFRSTQCAASWRTLSASATAAARTCFSCASSDSARTRSLRRFCFSNLSSSARDWPAAASAVVARPRRSGYARAEGRAPKRALSPARVRDTSAWADCNCDCAAVKDLRSAAIWALTAPGKPSKPAKRTAMMPAVNRTARMRNDDLLIRFACFEKGVAQERSLTVAAPIRAATVRKRFPHLRLAVDRDVSRVETGGQRDGEGLAFGLSDPQQALSVLGEKLPVVEAGGRRLVIAPGLYFLAQPVHPGRAIEIERVGRILPLVHLRQVVFAQAEIFQRDLARVGVKEDLHLFVAAEAHAHAAVEVRSGQFHPGPGTGFVSRAAVHGGIQIGHVDT